MSIVNPVRRIGVVCFMAALLPCATACPDGQYSTCIVPNPFGGCIQSACVPKVGGSVGQATEAAKRAVTVDPLRIVVNPGFPRAPRRRARGPVPPSRSRVAWPGSR